MSTPAELQARIDQLETANDSAAVTSAPTEALGAYALQPGAAAQLSTILGPSIQVHRDETRNPVVTADGYRPVAELVREKLTSPEYQHFLRNDGNAPTGQPNRRHPTRDARGAASPRGQRPGSLGDAQRAAGACGGRHGRSEN